MWLDGSVATNIMHLESILPCVRITLKARQQVRSSYYPGTNTLYWGVDYRGPSSGYNWQQQNPLVGLSHELQHLYNDICKNMDPETTSRREREESAVAAENRIRRALFNVDPRNAMWPRPGYTAVLGQQVADVPGATTAAEAWQYWDGSFIYIAPE